MRTIICEICGETKTFFGKKSRFTCSKKCAKIREKRRTKQWRAENKEYARNYMRSWNNAHRDHLRYLGKKYRDENKDMLNIRQGIYGHAAIILRKRHFEEYNQIVAKLTSLAESKAKVYNRKPKSILTSMSGSYKEDNPVAKSLYTTEITKEDGKENN